jgi:hypothetical protein
VRPKGQSSIKGCPVLTVNRQHTRGTRFACPPLPCPLVCRSVARHEAKAVRSSPPRVTCPLRLCCLWRTPPRTFTPRTGRGGGVLVGKFRYTAEGGVEYHPPRYPPPVAIASMRGNGHALPGGVHATGYRIPVWCTRSYRPTAPRISRRPVKCTSSAARGRRDRRSKRERRQRTPTLGRVLPSSPFAPQSIAPSGRKKTGRSTPQNVVPVGGCPPQAETIIAPPFS